MDEKPYQLLAFFADAATTWRTAPGGWLGSRGRESAAQGVFAGARWAEEGSVLLRDDEVHGPEGTEA